MKITIYGWRGRHRRRYRRRYRLSHPAGPSQHIHQVDVGTQDGRLRTYRITVG